MRLKNFSKWVCRLTSYVILCGLCLCVFSVNASILDWDTVNWPTGSLSETFAVGGGNVTITFSGDTGALTTVADGSPGAPEENNFQTGGIVPPENSLFIRMDFPEGTPAVNAQTISVTYAFTHPGGIRAPAFTIFDIDSGLDQWQDAATASAVRANGTVVTPTSIITGPASTSNGVDTATGSAGAGNASADGNVTFLFDFNDITTFTFTYRNNAPNTAGTHNQWAAMHDLTFNSPAVTDKVFSPNNINANDVSTLTLTLDNPDPTAVATLTADLVDTMPTGVTIASPANVGGTCPGTVNATAGGSTVTYTSGSQIPANSSCTITVDVTSSTPGTHTNTIPAGSLLTNIGDNSAETSADLTVNSPPGGVTCPAGTNLVNLAVPRNATTVNPTGNVTGTIANGAGPILAIGTNVANPNEPRLTNTPASVTLGFPDLVPFNGNIILSMAQDNAAGVLDIQDSTDNSAFSAPIAFTGSNPIDDRIEHLNYSVASTGGAQFVRFTLTSGGFRVDGLQYSQICEPAPEADINIEKDDSSLNYAPGGTGTYELTITNNGPSSVAGVTIADNLPNGVTLSGAWSCTASAGSSCSSANGGSAGDSSVNLTADIINAGVITVTVPVQYSTNMSDF